MQHHLNCCCTVAQHWLRLKVVPRSSYLRPMSHIIVWQQAWAGQRRGDRPVWWRDMRPEVQALFEMQLQMGVTSFVRSWHVYDWHGEIHYHYAYVDLVEMAQLNHQTGLYSMLRRLVLAEAPISAY